MPLSNVDMDLNVNINAILNIDRDRNQRCASDGGERFSHPLRSEGPDCSTRSAAMLMSTPFRVQARGVVHGQVHVAVNVNVTATNWRGARSHGRHATP